MSETTPRAPIASSPLSVILTAQALSTQTAEALDGCVHRRILVQPGDDRRTQAELLTALDEPQVDVGRRRREPFEEASEIYDCISINFEQYVLIQNSITGVIRIEKGPAKVIVLPFEKVVKV